MFEKAKIMDAKEMDRALARIAHQIIEKNHGAEKLCIIGIQRRGVPLAEQIAKYIADFEETEVPMGVLDITFYRDDLSMLDKHPLFKGTDIDFDVNEKSIVIVDDVLYTGRTARAAMEAIMDLGRPDKIQLAVLIDRGHRELPIRADYVGKNLPTSRSEAVSVRLMEFAGARVVVILENEA